MRTNEIPMQWSMKNIFFIESSSTNVDILTELFMGQINLQLPRSMSWK